MGDKEDIMIKGSIVALVTPFDEAGSVDHSRLRELINWHIDEGTDAILVLGTTGETPALSEEEQDAIVRTAVAESRGRVPIIANSGCNNTEKTIAKSIRYEKMGADALLVITPYYNKPNKSGMKEHFTRTADAVGIPVYIYNVPARTGICIDAETVGELSKHPNIALSLIHISLDLGSSARAWGFKSLKAHQKDRKVFFIVKKGLEPNAHYVRS